MRLGLISNIYIYYYAEAAITLYTNKLYTHTVHDIYAMVQQFLKLACPSADKVERPLTA